MMFGRAPRRRLTIMRTVLALAAAAALAAALAACPRSPIRSVTLHPCNPELCTEPGQECHPFDGEHFCVDVCPGTTGNVPCELDEFAIDPADPGVGCACVLNNPAGRSCSADTDCVHGPDSSGAEYLCVSPGGRTACQPLGVACRSGGDCNGGFVCDGASRLCVAPAPPPADPTPTPTPDPQPDPPPLPDPTPPPPIGCVSISTHFGVEIRDVLRSFSAMTSGCPEDAPGLITFDVRNDAGGGGDWCSFNFEGVWDSGRLRAGQGATHQAAVGPLAGRAIHVAVWSPGFAGVAGSGGGAANFRVPDGGNLTVIARCVK